ncbi:MAG: aldolase/citrate lyase family protein [Ilumatobacteraceae bacterium]
MAFLNGMINRFVQNEPALGTIVECGNYWAARAAGDSAADFALVDMEHLNFSFPDLGNTLQWFLGRGNATRAQFPATPIVRIPPNAAERNQWIPKQVLDYGAFGIVLPHACHPADVEAMVEAMRYPQGPKGSGPSGHRGLLHRQAMRYWGIKDNEEWFERADLWPLNPKGELLLVLLVEEVTAWENIEQLVAVPGVGAVLWGPGDGSLSIGNRSLDMGNPELESYRQHVVGACRAAGVPVGNPFARNLRESVDQGFGFHCMQQWDRVQAADVREYSAAKR